jgi:hypothetical protein
MSINHLPADTRLFRFISIFELYDLLFLQRLRLTKFSVFEDENEGLGVILKQQTDPLGRFSENLDHEKIKKNHRKILNNNYATCWSTEPNSIAMWALYSSNRDSIRVETTVGKLLQALRKFDQENSFANFIDAPATRRAVSTHHEVGAVEYVNFFELRDQIRVRFQLFTSLVSEKARFKTDYFEW